jgi:amino acid transporter
VDGLPWPSAAVRYRREWLPTADWVDVLQVLIVFSILSNTIASTNSVVRIQYGMGRARALPRQLGWTLPGRQTPYVSILLTLAVSLAVTLIPGLVWSPTSLFAWLGFGIGLAAAVTFILIALAALRYFQIARAAAGLFRRFVVPIVAIVILFPVVYTSFDPNPGYPLNWAPRVILIWLGVGVLYLIWRIVRREKVDIDYAFREAGEPVPPEALATEPKIE